MTMDALLFGVWLLLGYYVCLCPMYYTGVNCALFDRSVTPGIGKSTSPSPTDPTILSECTYMSCREKAGNGQCDIECNIPACNYDNEDCSSETRPWAYCDAPRDGVLCSKVFNDSKCDPQCDNEECLYDGFDCVQQLQACNPLFDKYCSVVYANGVCNPGCNTTACNWDGLDCNHEEEHLALGTLVIILAVQPDEFRNTSNGVLRKLGNLLRAVLVVKQDQFGQDMIYPWYADEKRSSNISQSGADTSSSSQNRAADGTKVYLLIDIQPCLQVLHECFDTSLAAAEFISAAVANGWNSPFAIKGVYSLTVYTKPGLAVKTVSACHGVDKNCDYVTLTCNSSKMIQLLGQTYGYKNYKCDTKKRSCLTEGQGCCAYAPEDCNATYTDLDNYDLHRKCSGLSDCGPLQVPRAMLEECAHVSTYATIDYRCVPESRAIGFCDNRNITGDVVDLMFHNGAPPTADRHVNCSCLIKVDASSTVTITAVDIRLTKEHNVAGRGSLCSSSNVVVGPYSDSPDIVTCDANEPNENNFVYKVARDIELTTTDMFYIDLNYLYMQGPDDSPTMVWLALEAKEAMSVTCFQNEMPTTTVGTSTTVVPTTTDDGGGSHNSTIAAASSDDGGNTAVVVGVLVPTVLVMAAAVVVGVVLWRRKRKPANDRKPTTRGHDHHDNRNSSVANEIYDEIGFVPDLGATETRTPSPHTGDAANGHVYENTKQMKENKTEKHAHKSSKLPYIDIKAARMRLLSYFHRQNDQNASTATSEQQREARGSYDHIVTHPPIAVKVTPPDADVAHTYSHTADVGNNNKDKNQGNKTPEPPKLEIPHSDSVHAVQLADSYIEFQFGDKTNTNNTPAKQQKNIITSDKTNNSPKPTKPNRPPPKPGAIPDTPTRSPKPPVSPKTSGVPAEGLDYDYAENEATAQHSRCPSDVSQHSYKILDPEPAPETTYDYADDDVEDLTIAPPVPDNIYEEVNENNKAKSKKYKSASDLPQDIVGYLEPNVGNNRPRSIPADIADITGNSNAYTNLPPIQATATNSKQKSPMMLTPPTLHSKPISPILPRRAIATTADKQLAGRSDTHVDEVHEPAQRQTSDNTDTSVHKMAKLFDQGNDNSVTGRSRGGVRPLHNDLGLLAAGAAVGRMSSDA